MDFLQKLTYKNKLIVLITGFIIALIIVYSMALSETNKIAREYKNIKAKLDSIQTAPKQIQLLETRLARIDKLLGSNYQEDIDQQEILLEQVSQYCNSKNIILKEFPGVHSAQLNDYIIETYFFTVEGPFIKLLKLLYSLEINYSFGKINSIEFKTYRNIKQKKDVLRMTVFVQNIKNIKS
ncbi:MAG: hypothetical protein JXB17_10510 [Bacteroidales bacterium]|nr:hypothetical protein [Bacteroidales bacterium]